MTDWKGLKTMTQNSTTEDRPSTRDRLEDLGISYEELCEVMATWQDPPAPGVDVTSMTVDALWDSKGAADLHYREWAEQKGRITRELERRVKEAHPDFGPEDGGSREIVGETIRVAMTYSRTERVNAEVVAELAAMATEEGSALNYGEYEDLVKWEPKVNGVKANVLKKRGGALAEVLARVKTLTGSRPEFEARAR